MLLPDGNLVQFRGRTSPASRLTSGVSAVMFPDNLRGIKVGLIGDSIQAANSSKSAAAQHYEANGIWTQYQYRNVKRFAFRDEYNKAVGGDTAQNFLASSTAEIDDLVAMGCEILVDSYGRNDISAGRTAAELVADRLAIHDYAFDAGIKAIFVESVKPSDYGSNTATYNARSTQANAQLEADAAQDHRKIFIDTWSKWDNGSSYPAAGMTYDNIHATPIGGLAGAEAYDATLTPIYGRGEALRLTDANLITNGALTGTSGSNGTGTSGDVSNGFTGQASGTTGAGTSRAFSKTSDGGQKVVIHVDSGNRTDEFAYLTWDQTANFKAGEKYRVTAEGEPISGTNAYWYGLQVNCRNSGGSSLLVVSDMDKQTLMRSADFAIIERLANVIIGESDEDKFEEYEKN